MRDNYWNNFRTITAELKKFAQLKCKQRLSDAVISKKQGNNTHVLAFINAIIKWGLKLCNQTKPNWQNMACDPKAFEVQVTKTFMHIWWLSFCWHQQAFTKISCDVYKLCPQLLRNVLVHDSMFVWTFNVIFGLYTLVRMVWVSYSDMCVL